MKKLLILVVCIFSFSSITGCSSYKTLTVSQQKTWKMNSYQVSPPVAEGDQIKYLMSDGRKGEMVIQAVNTHALIGQNGLQLPLDQIVTLERKETSPGKTAMATGAGIGAGAIIVVTILSIGLVSALIAAG